MNIQEIDIDKHYKETGDVLTTDQKKRGLLIYAFQQIQKEYNYLPEDKLRELSKKLDIPLADVYSAASFYKHFYFKPRGKNVVCVCMGTACHVRGASKVLHKLEDEFGVKEGETTKDGMFSLMTARCIGACALAPAVSVGDDVFGKLTADKVGHFCKIDLKKYA